jgi:hypothetical protein
MLEQQFLRVVLAIVVLQILVEEADLLPHFLGRAVKTAAQADQA